MSWIVLVVAGLMEVAWAAALSRADQPMWAVVTLVTLLGSVGLLAFALRTIPLGVAYAVWVGIGILGTTSVSVLVHGHGLSSTQWGFLALIVVGILGMKASAHDEDEAPAATTEMAGTERLDDAFSS